MTGSADDTPKRRQYTAAFLSGSFGLTLAQAQEILAKAGEDRIQAADLARAQRSVERL